MERVLGGLLILLVFVSRPSLAAEVRHKQNQLSWPVTCESADYIDRNGDGRPEIMDARCAFDEQLEGRVTVIALNGEVQPLSTDGHLHGRFIDELWVFDAGGDGSAELIVSFYEEGSALVAALYDAYPEEKVDYEFHEGEVRVQGGAPATVRVVALDGWWSRGGTVNFDLDIYVDGPVAAVFVPLPEIERWAEPDGSPDFVIRVRDTDGDGRPDLDWRTAFAPAEYREARTFLMVNVAGNEPPIESWFAWPYLGPRSYGYLTSSPHPMSLPPIQVDWTEGRIVAVGEFVRSRGNDGQWFAYSTDELVPGQSNVPNFESPFAWYDLAADADRQAELAIRFVYYPPNDTAFHGGRIGFPFNLVRYSWDQTNDGSWDFKLGLLGAYAVDSRVSLPNFDLEMIPYEELPGWISAREWTPAVFVASEREGVSGEGIYVWDPSTAMTDYFLGLRDQPFGVATHESDEFPGIPPGFRGDYRLLLEGRPYLYLSTIDLRLHLVGAEGGVWNLGDGREIHYGNLGSDQYLDQWLYVESGELIRQLYRAQDHLIYAGDGQVALIQAEGAPALFITLPPRNHEEWAQLGADLETHKPTFAPHDFAAMFGQFAGPRFSVTGASLRDFRLTADSFRFILELQPGYTAQGDIGPNLLGLEPGAYVVTYNGEFAVQPATPARPQVVPGSLRLSSPAPAELEPVQIHAVVRNDGLEDLPVLRLQAWAQGPGWPAVQIIAESEVTLLAGEAVPVRFDWTPPAAGEWQITLAWGPGEEPDPLPVAADGATVSVHVSAQPPLGPRTAWQISNVRQPATVVLLLASMSASAAALGVLAMRAGRRSR